MITLDNKQDTTSTVDLRNELADIIEKLSDIHIPEVSDQVAALKLFEKKHNAEWFISKLYHSLLIVFKGLFYPQNNDFLSILVEKIREVSECDTCSLWRINFPDNPKDDRREPSVSLIARTLKPGLKDKAGNNADIHLQGKNEYFVHKIKPSFTQTILAKHQNDPKQEYFHFLCSESEVEIIHHTCLDFIRNCGIQHIVAIPVLRDDKIIAILFLYFKEKPANGLLDEEILPNKESLLDKEGFPDKGNGLLESFSGFVSKCIYYCNRLVLSQKKQTLLNELMNEYQQVGQTNLKELFERFIKAGGIFQKYFQYAGASFFVWDDLNNYYQLCSTTGLFWHKDNLPVLENEYHDVFYTPAQGITGNSANSRENRGAKILIYDNYPEFRKKNAAYQSKMPHEVRVGKNLMLVPISSPTDPEEVIGILRFVVKKHPSDSGIIDYFNDTDKALFKYVTRYLALIIQGYLAENKQIRQFARITHEAYAPAQAILLDIQHLIRYRDDVDFQRERFLAYYHAIEYSATVLQYQSESNLLSSKLSAIIGRPPFEEIYPEIKKISLRKLLHDCKYRVIPIARAAGVSFDKITIHGRHDVQLFLDEKAFQIVFYNLLTNAIKYRYLNDRDSFQVDVIIREKTDHYTITVEDYGIGIYTDQKENIFYAGNRGNRERDNIQGFGMGLHIAKTIVEDFGGRIFVSYTRSPTAITIELPFDLSFRPPRRKS